jgi:diaminohydroxyphosphoribosylaminopyrimidine deaminase/5-amino-6-(5-phosphoribosylamino)uracil reductase
LATTARLYASGASVLHVRSDDPHDVVRALDLNSAKTTLIDGGPTLVSAFIRAGLADELHVYLAPKLLGTGLPAVQDLGITTLAQAHEYSLVHCERRGNDVFLRFMRDEPQDAPSDPILNQNHNR